MATVISTLSDFISYVNTLYNGSSTAPSSGEEDYTVWTALANIAVNVWENEEGMLWNELFVKLSSAPDGDKTTDGTNSYTLPTLFSFPASGYVWVGETPYKVIKPEDIQLFEDDRSEWCYFLNGSLEFNPELTMSTGDTIEYNYYKKATKLTTGTDEFEMSDPMFAVYFVLAELKKEEGNASEIQMAAQKLESMKTKNVMPAWYQEDSLLRSTDTGFGI